MLDRKGQGVREVVDAAKALLAHWDGDGTGKERRGEYEGVEYWSPAGRMVSTEFIVALRSAVEGHDRD